MARVGACVSAVRAPAVDFTCNDNPVEQVATFKYLALKGLFHAYAIPSIIYPCRANQSEGWWFLVGCSAASFIAAVWQYHQPAFALNFVTSYPGACLTWVSDLVYA